ncbi:putative drug exporter of the RND superfamily [Neorhodopirellula lusitana]|uniref:Drug exporter of the RND superfamily n=1 Tax=Neorhodopirellula lusitana TaxID=445327 RepID=A0ABY1PZ64_9BACT|nr:MMPL family transporter [Neorhodopirellula lusitana]SMP53743.1 putative drug exporter of the RND superfamily [Neorhodopirellula lusitana]
MTATPQVETSRFARFVVGHAKWILISWVLIAILAKTLAPSWKAVALDGDFEYLPQTQTSVAGGQLLDRAFTGTRPRSGLVVVFAKSSEKWSVPDRLLGLDVLRRLYHRLAEVSWQRAELMSRGELAESEVVVPLAKGRWYDVAAEALDQAIEIDAEFYELLGERVPDTKASAYEPRLAIAYWDRSQLSKRMGGKADPIASDEEAARILNPDIESLAPSVMDRTLKPWRVLLDVYSWQESLIGSQLKRPKARIAALTLSSELAATGNIALLEELQELIDDCHLYQSQYLGETEMGPSRDLKVRITGSAAIGGQTLLAARSAITYTEWFTVAMILIILAVIYRAPLLVAVPLISIGVAVVTAMALVTLLTQLSQHIQWSGLDLRVYTTSRIFVVVILFGAGTDYCLFLISRLREEATLHPWPVACGNALSNVSGALLGSALTTIVGLGMLWFADFGKFHHTGPIIAICLSVGLLVCMTMTPALLRLLGPAVFWPTRLNLASQQPNIKLLSNSSLQDGESGKGAALLQSGSRFWSGMAIALTRYPVWTLAAGWILLILPAIGGVVHERSVTYDLSGQLDWASSSRQGMRLLNRSFGVGELTPISILALADSDQDEATMLETRDRLTALLYRTEGIRRVRTMSDPLGDFPPDREMGLLSSDAWKRRTLQNHRLAKLHFIASEPDYANRLIRMDVIVHEDPFSQAAADRLSDIASRIQQSFDNTKALTGTNWQLLYSGTTPSIVDLREVTLSDTRRIKIAVIVAVLLVLIVVIRRVVLSLYLIVTVLLSYYATLGLTYWFFRYLDGPEFLGLDWKLPLFLFVILVAVGQDYNVYLVTRIMEERRRLGSLAAVRRAVARTGGIVTACGFVMAATFLSMTSSAWWPLVTATFGMTGSFGEIAGATSATGMLQQTTLRGITELGFALGLGVLIDTLYVRTVLVPSFVVLLDRWQRPT